MIGLGRAGIARETRCLAASLLSRAIDPFAADWRLKRRTAITIENAPALAETGNSAGGIAGCTHRKDHLPIPRGPRN